MASFRERLSAARGQISIDKSSLYLGIICGVIVGVLLSSIVPFLLGSVGSAVSGGNEVSNPEVSADIVLSDLRSSESLVVVQLVKEPDADSVYVRERGGDVTVMNASEDVFIGSQGNASVGSTVSVSVGSTGGDIVVESGSVIEIVGVKDGYEEVLYSFTA